MGDIRFERELQKVTGAEDRAQTIRRLTDEGVIAALAGATHAGQPMLANILATEAMNRIHRLGITLQHLSDAVAMLDDEGRVRFLNPAAERLLGRQEGDLRGRDFHEAVGHAEVEPYDPLDHPRASDRLPHAECPILQSLQTGREFHRKDHDVFRDADGTPFLVEFEAVPVLPDSLDTEPSGVVVVFRDVTVRKREEERVRLYETTMDHAPDGVLWVREDGTFRYVNKRAALNLGYEQDELLERTAFQIDPHLSPEVWGDIWRRIAEDHVGEVETEHVKKDGRRIPMRLTIQHINVAEGAERFHCVFARPLESEGHRPEVNLRDRQEG